MSTRLERLFALLETGSTSTRQAAALQLGQIPKQTHELRTVFSRLILLLRSSSWETRIAAGQALGAIAENVSSWDATGPSDPDANDVPLIFEDKFRLHELDLVNVVAQGAPLVGSEGREYESTQDADVSTLQLRRSAFNEHLGLGTIAEKTGLDSLASELVADSDLLPSTSLQSLKPEGIPLKNMLISPALDDSLSVRQRNRFKRKLKSSISRTVSCEDDLEMDTEKSAATQLKRLKSQSDSQSTSVEQDGNETNSGCDQWPFSRLLEDLSVDLFHPDWHIRHGAATGVRELIRVHGGSVGKLSWMSLEQTVIANHRWLEDIAFRLLCVLALERFGDFVGYEVVAPVSETCAQALGAVVKWLPADLTDQIIDFLLVLVKQKNWQARHGGLLGIKYAMLVKKNTISHVFPKVEPVLVARLRDEIDDVCAVAASALEAVMDEFIYSFPEEVPKVLTSLWNGLLDFDDLTSWTTSFMTLLSTIITKCDLGGIVNTQQASLDQLIPRLWPFLEHPSPKIRSCVLRTVEMLVQTVNPSSESKSWLTLILPDLLRRLYRRAILENDPNVHNDLRFLWKTCVAKGSLVELAQIYQSMTSAWLALSMQSASVPVDTNLFDLVNRTTVNGSGEKHMYLAGNELAGEDLVVRDVNVTRTRMLCASLVAIGIERLIRNRDSATDIFRSISSLLIFHLQSKSASQKVQSAMIVYDLADLMQQYSISYNIDKDFNEMKQQLITCLEENVFYDELAATVTSMHSTCLSLVQELRAAGATLQPEFSRPVLTMEICQQLVENEWTRACATCKVTSKSVLQTLSLRRNEAVLATQLALAEYNRLSSRVKLSYAVALIKLSYTPAKLAPLIRPLMETLKRNPNCILQSLAADSLADLMVRIVDESSSSGSTEKIIKNLCSYVCADSDQTPSLDQPFAHLIANICKDEICLPTSISGILSLLPLSKETEKKQGGAKSSRSDSTDGGSSVSQNNDSIIDQNPVETSRLGGECGLKAICRIFGKDLSAKLPALAEQRLLITLRNLKEQKSSDVETLHNLFILSRLIDSLHSDLLDLFLRELANLAYAVGHQKTAIRYVAARLIANWAAVQMCRKSVMEFVCTKILAMLTCSEAVHVRQGAIETIACIIERLGIEITEHIVKLTVPVMRRMTDQNEAVRLMASQAFGVLVRLLPLGMAVSTNAIGIEEEVSFLEQLLDSKKMLAFNVTVPIQVQLRAYQQEGVNWLHFLSRYNLHGILCDDMGLGKTLQAVCILASEYHNKDNSVKKFPSLVICPSTLIGHWAKEVAKFVKPEHLNTLQYEGTPVERAKLRSTLSNYSLVISSYEIVKNDIEYFRTLQWDFCVLDEGHVIRNTKTRIFKAVKQITCSHRLILSGTPVQNNAQDLWALFDFLMPGLLGSEKRFAARFGKPIDSSRDAKASSKDIEEGVLAMENLHKQVLPFILRRLKEDVLKDLPPKIIQDYYCDLSPLQLLLYEDFAKSKAQKDAIQSLISASNSTGRNNAFQAFQYLRRVCNHPALVLNASHPRYNLLMRELEKDRSSMYEIQHAAKFVALQQLLLDCGIGVEDEGHQSVVNCHRALIFCQLSSMLQMLEQHLFRAHMPSVSYLKLDGSVPPKDRQNIVERFNNDPSIDVLLLTTSVGGLGLNLTGADTVIFVEHDWNPAKDMQAMDRAHRIGQKKVVNVYRLITRGTVEEKIMGLQKFKLHVANSIITQENSALQSLATEQIVDLFSVESTTSSRRCKSADQESAGKGLKAVLENLESLWDSSQYDSEYDVDRFMESLKFTAAP